MDINSSSIVSPASIIKDHGIEFLESIQGISNIVINKEIPVIVTRCKVPIFRDGKGCDIDLFILTEGKESYISLTSLRRFIEYFDPEVSNNNKFKESNEKKHHSLGTSPDHITVKEIHDKFRDKHNKNLKSYFIKWEDVALCGMLNNRLKELNIGITSVLIIGEISKHLIMGVSQVLNTRKRNDGFSNNQLNMLSNERQNNPTPEVQENSLVCIDKNINIDEKSLKLLVDKRISVVTNMMVQKCFSVMSNEFHNQIMITMKEELREKDEILSLLPSDIQEAYVGLKVSTKNSQCVKGHIGILIHSFSICIGPERENSSTKQGFYVPLVGLGEISISRTVSKIKRALDLEKYVARSDYVAKATGINIRKCLGREDFMATINIIANTLDVGKILNHYIVTGDTSNVMISNTEQGLNNLYAINCFYYPIYGKSISVPNSEPYVLGKSGSVNYTTARGDIWSHTVGYSSCTTCMNIKCNFKMHRNAYDTEWKIYRSKYASIEDARAFKYVWPMCPGCFEYKNMEDTATVIQRIEYVIDTM